MRLTHKEELGQLTQSLYTTTTLVLHDIERLYCEKVERIAKLEHALYNMAFAYVNKEPESPHQFEIDAIEETKTLIDVPFLR